ncbi:MAG TPA: NAD(P)(+) transhydrogenase (Re/Si-specific) subunit beta [Kiritimatiellia bacterium]|nr:NAD(P)(+) transhydrogenase (Re/Si-specific) subunit beta [Kiritimatiellia bacterium]HMP00233.1 NAD(P)(+) transhydrogenase (Re/Si-specific) subunit beta [Kiritimatiellia bacterium]HMP97186.1 NAD(P)(+) transhydrogenase (Re/Si-specific) subunit beta [Kiritimatiellia bacterium]
MSGSILINLAYIVAAVLFIFGLKMLGKATTAPLGNLVSALGMLLAIVATLLIKDIVSYKLIFAGFIIGGAIGAIAAQRVKMTAMPEMVALFNGFGGLASLLVGWSEYHRALNFHPENLDAFTMVATYLAVIIGGITFTGSLIAFAKLAEKMTGKPILFKAQKPVNAGLLAAAVIILVMGAMAPASTYPLFLIAILIALALGVLAVIPIGGADMPVVISLLNSYSGIAASAAGFVIMNNVLVVAGCLVGASGIILTQIMCKAMNRSLANVLFSGFGATTTASAAGAVQGEAKPITADDAYYILEAARSVIVVPGYGMAVAQAQHVVRELGEMLEKNGCEVKYAIHPVAGRMPGHMNVLLAEANVPYEQLVEPPDVNPIMTTIDVAIVIGANDVVNPAAREDETSPIYGMPIINVDEAKTCFVLKRSMASGFAGIENPLFFKENTRMLFGDAKASVTALVAQFKDAG